MPMVNLNEYLKRSTPYSEEEKRELEAKTLAKGLRCEFSEDNYSVVYRLPKEINAAPQAH